MKTRFLLSFILSLGLATLLLTPANAVHINVMNGDHDIINGQYADHLGLVGLGHTATLLSDSASGWETATSGTSIILVEEQGGGSVNVADAQSFISGGGRMIVLGGYPGYGGITGYPNDSNATLMNSIMGWSLTAGSYGADMEVFSQTDAVAGTTFADDPDIIYGLSSHHEIESGVPTGIDVFYQGGRDPIVFRATYGTGDLFYVGWDYCCGGTTEQANDWYSVLDSAINFESTPIPEPATMLLFGSGLIGLAGVGRKKFRK